MNLQPFDPLPAVKMLLKHGVRFVVIGGWAGRLHGSPSITNDLDICHERTRDNLERLASALQELKATLRGAPRDVPFQLDALTLEAGDHFTFETTAGALDILGRPAGSQGYEELSANAEPKDLDGVEVKVASVADLIRMKQAAGRPRDLVEAEILGALQEEIDKRESE